MAHDLIIRNGTVIDGTGAAGVAADVAIDADSSLDVLARLGRMARLHG